MAAATVAALLLGLLTLLTAAPAQAVFGADEARKAILDLRGRVADNEKRAQEAIDAMARTLETAQRS
ncbi:MAG: tol-pal system protein YbgF, partial [Betaproteobacteria bacterium]